MLAKLLGIVLLIIGGIFAFKVAAALLGVVLGLVGMAIALVLPVALIYWGYRLIRRDRDPVYY